ncbi:MAG: SRPBCC domain-containing protein [Gammaproteobacteria bacterium]|nr:SRPBCC domain-containing protein [Pseudomonadales bacterium]
MTFFGEGGPGGGKPVRFQIRRSFNAPLETVFDAWLIPYLAGSWIFGPRNVKQEVLTLENKPLPGGTFLLEVIRDGHRQSLTGTYREIRRPEKLQCTIGVDPEAAELTLLTMELAEEDGKTRMKLGFELTPEIAGQADLLRSEWGLRCRALAEQVDKPRPQPRLFR